MRNRLSIVLNFLMKGALFRLGDYLSEGEPEEWTIL